MADPAELETRTGATDAIAEERLQRAATYIEAEEGATNRYRGGLALVATALLVGMSLFHLYAAVEIVPAQVLRPVHVGWMLLLVFLLFPIAARYRNRLMWWDVVCAALGVATIVYLLAGGDDIWDRNTLPSQADVFFGVTFVLLVLEAVRRTSGWILLFVIGTVPRVRLSRPVAARTVGAPRLRRRQPVGLHVPDARRHLRHRGRRVVVAHHPVHDLRRVPAALGRRQVLPRLELRGDGQPAQRRRDARWCSRRSCWAAPPVPASRRRSRSARSPTRCCKRAGYGAEAAGGLLAAGGLGAIISPPVLGAAAFLIAEFLKISYLDVLLMAIVPTLLYYLSLFLMVEFDTRRFGLADLAVAVEGQLAALTKRYWYHFVSLVAIVAFMVWGFSPVLAVFWATVVTFAVSFLRRETAMGWRQVVAALRDGSGQMLNVAATCAAAGIIVGVVVKTGLGLKFSAIVIAYAGGSLFLDGAVHGADRLGDRPRRAGDGELHHLRGDRRAGADQARRARLRGAHVHLLLRGALRGVAADRTVAVRGRGDHRRRPVPDDAAVVEIHAARVRRAVRVRPRSRRRRAAAQAAEGRLVAARGLDRADRLRRASPRSPRARRGGCCAPAAHSSAGRSIACGLLLVYPAPAADVIGLAGFGAILARQWVGRRRAAA